MGVADRFRQLDDAIVPNVGSRLYRGLVSGITRAVAVTALAALGLTVIVALWWTEDDDATSAERASESGTGTIVGPPAGMGEDSYIARTREQLNELVEQGEGSAASPHQVWAVASVAEFMTPEQFDQTIDPQLVQRIFVHPQLEEVESRSVEIEVSHVPGGLSGALERLAEQKEQQAKEKYDLAQTLTGNSASEQMQRERYRSESQFDYAQSRALRGDCQCVYGAVLNASVEVLAYIEQSEEVRAVHVAPPEVQGEAVTFVPVLPSSAPATSHETSSLDE